MLLGKLAVCAGLFIVVSASRVVGGKSQSTTTFFVKGHINLHNSELKCYAREDVAVRFINGNTVQYTAGMELPLRNNTGFVSDPNWTSPSWYLGVRQVAAANLEVVDRTDRDIPNFNCVVFNEHKKNETILCGTASNGMRSTNNSVVCDVEITDSNPRVRVIFKIEAWAANDTKHVSKFQPRVHCESKTDLIMEEKMQARAMKRGTKLIEGGTADVLMVEENTQARAVNKTTELIEGGTALVPAAIIHGKQTYRLDSQLTFTDFNHKYDGFTCLLMNDDAVLDCGSVVRQFFGPALAQPGGKLESKHSGKTGKIEQSMRNVDTSQICHCTNFANNNNQK